MRNSLMACLLLLLVGCADFDSSVRPSFLDAKSDGPGLPKYLEKRQSVAVISTTHARLLAAQRDALLMLGCSGICQNSNTFRGDRAFIIGFVCGVGGETLYVTANPLAHDKYFVSAVSDKRFPYPEATRFLDADFRDLLVQLLNDPEYANAP